MLNLECKNSLRIWTFLGRAVLSSITNFIFFSDSLMNIYLIKVIADNFSELATSEWVHNSIIFSNSAENSILPSSVWVSENNS